MPFAYDRRMARARQGSFRGGIELPEEKNATQNSLICPPESIRRLRIPLAPSGGAASQPIVSPGERVDPSQCLAREDGPGQVDIFSPVGGRVVQMTTVAVAGPEGFRRSRALELAELSDPPDLPSASASEDWRGWSAREIRERLVRSGLTTQRNPSGPIGQWMHEARRAGSRMLVANALELQPYVTSTHRLLVEYGRTVVLGLAILGRAIDAQELVLAGDRRHTEEYKFIPAPARRHGVSLVALPHKYPTDADPILVKVLTGREVPLGGRTVDVGVAITDPATCLSAYRAVALDEPITGRVVTVSGERAAKPGNFYVPFGMSCRELIGQAEAPIVHGGPMVGLCCPEDAVVGPTTDALLALEAQVPPAPTPCIRCGWCRDHCPARLNVAVLNDIYELGELDQAKRLAAEACVGCGVCSYVCPARLPLRKRVETLKRTLLGERRQMPLFAASQTP